MSENTVQLSVPKRKKKKTLLRDDFVLEDFYAAVRNNRLDSIHVPHSDVFFVKACLEAKASQSSDSVLRAIKFTLQNIEAAMRAEGWSESRVLKPKRYLYK
jgi:glycosylphosphatidylinositol transamidase (GPIT) subunit GPI8